MNRRILLDLDGVLSDFVAAAAKFHDKDPSLAVCYGLEECWSIDPESFWNPLGYEFWANLPLTHEAHDVVEMCTEAVGIDNLAILTSPCHTHGCTDGKKTWVRKHFPAFARRCFIGHDKSFMASPSFLLVDDSEHQCHPFQEAGGHACLFPRPWNKNRHLAHDPLTELSKALKSFTEN